MAALPAAAEIYRCHTREGTTYQQLPCDDKAVGGVSGIPTEFPPANTEARERLFQREADLYKRLEAQRDRQVQEAALRAASEERALERERLAAAAAAAAQPAWVVIPRPSRYARTREASGTPRTHRPW